VKYALEHKSVILFDAAYEAYITDANLPHSIYEIPGARECASSSAVARRTAVSRRPLRVHRCSESLNAQTKSGEFKPLHPLWARRQTTKFNGVSYIVQRGAEALYSLEGKAQVRGLIEHYLGNAKVLREGAKKAGLKVLRRECALHLGARAERRHKLAGVRQDSRRRQRRHHARLRLRLEGRRLFSHQRVQQPRQCRGSRPAFAGIEV